MMTIDTLFTSFPVGITHSILLQWLNASASGKMDIAYCSHAKRPLWLELLADSEALLGGCREFGRLRWLMKRNVRCSRLVIYGLIPYDEILFVSEYIAHASRYIRTNNINSDNTSTLLILMFLAKSGCMLRGLRLDDDWAIARAAIPTSVCSQKWGYALANVLSNSAPVLCDLHASIATDWSTLLVEGVTFTALTHITVQIRCDSDLVSICKAAPQLQELTLHPITCSSVGLAAIGQNCHNLEKLSFGYVDGEVAVAQPDAGFVAIAQGCCKLESLEVGRCKQLTDVGLSAIATHCTQLAELLIGTNDNITDATLRALGPKLCSIIFEECANFTAAGILALATRCPLLHTVEFGMVDLTVELNIILAIPHLKNVRNLRLTVCDISDRILEHIAEHLTLLEDLGIPHWKHAYTVAGLTRVVQKCKNLKRLELGDLHADLNDTVSEQWKAMRPGLAVW